MADMLIGFALGLAIGSLVLRLGVQRYIRNKLALRKLIAEMYHADLMPEICRIEGLCDLAARHEGKFAQMALDEVRKHKLKVITAIKKYEKLQ